MKKIFLAGTALALVASCMICGCKKTGESSNPASASEKSEGKSAGGEGKVLNIYSWDSEFKTCLSKFYPGYNTGDDSINGVKVNWVIVPDQDGAYQDKLYEALDNQYEASDDEKVDIFLIQEGYALKFTDSSYALDVRKNLGFSDSDLSNQFKYTKDVATNFDGELKALSWQANPSGLIYRRSIAKEVLGTDSPDEVQEKLSDWEKFSGAASEAKSKGFFMLPDYNSSCDVFAASVKEPWVVNGTVSVAPAIKDWVKRTKTYAQKGYIGKGESGKVMCYFGSSRLFETLAQKESGSKGDWGFIAGPQSYASGGSWICAATGTDNQELVKDILRKMTSDTDVMTKIAGETGAFVNNEGVMSNLAQSSYKNDFLGGQNPLPIMVDVAKSFEKGTVSVYDEDLTDILKDAMSDYFDGACSEDEAWSKFETLVTDKYFNLMF